MSNTTYKITKKKNLLFILLTLFAGSIYSSAQTVTGYLDGQAICCENTNVSFTADYEGADDLVYQFSIDGLVIQAYSSGNVFNQDMTMPGTFEVMVEVSSESNPAIYEFSTVTIEVIAIPVANAGSDEHVCEGAAVSIGSAPQSDVIYSWEPAGLLDDATLSNPTTQVLPAGTYTFTLTAASNVLASCFTTDEVTVEVVAIPVADAGMDALICEGTVVSIGSTAQSNTIYSWEPADLLDDASVSNPATQILPVGIYTFALTATSSKLSTCTASDDVTVEVVSIPIADAGEDALICEGIIVGIGSTAQSNTIYSWEPAGLLDDPSVSNPTTQILPAGIHTFTVTATSSKLSSCFTTDDVTVEVVAIPAANVGKNTFACEGTSITIGAAPENDVIYSWTPASLLQNPSVSNPTIQILPIGTYNLTLTATSSILSTCTASDYITVEVVSKPVANAGSDALICEGTSTRIGSAPQSEVTYSWSPNYLVVDAGDSNPMTTNLTTGIHTFTMTAASSKLPACATTDNVVITARKKPVANAGSNRTICDGFTTQLGGAGETWVNYVWSPQSLDDYTLPNPVTHPLSSTTTFNLYASWDDLPSCYSSSSVTVTIKSNPIVTAGSDRTICEGATTTLGGSSVAGVSYSWTPTLVNNPDISNPTTIGLINSTRFIVTASTTSAPVCVSKDTVDITVIKNATIY